MTSTRYTVIGNGQEWCNYCWKAYRKVENTFFYNGFYSIIKNAFLRCLCKNHFGYIERYKLSLPLKCIWYPYLFKLLGFESNLKDQVVVFYDWGPLAKDVNFPKYLKRRMPDVMLVYIFTNVIRKSGAHKYHTFEKIRKAYDKIFVFDKEDTLLYHYETTPLIYTKDPDYMENEKEYDVFFVGNAKDRLDSLHEIYERCEEAGLKCCFYINSVSLNKQKYSGVHYNQPLTYQAVVEYISKSKCIVDSIQGGTSAMTLRACEAVMYNKKLITTNANVKSEPYYKPDGFLVYPTEDNIASFVNKEWEGFSDTDRTYFSPESLFERITKK